MQDIIYRSVCQEKERKKQLGNNVEKRLYKAMKVRKGWRGKE